MRFIKGKVFIDTNVLVYTQNDLEKEKQQICRSVLNQIIKKNNLVISTQIIQEYYNVSTLKLGLDKHFVKSTINHFDFHETILLKPNLILQAIDIQIVNQLSFWDSLVISAAKSANCTTILTEDLNDGQSIEGIKIQSPFSIEF